MKAAQEIAKICVVKQKTKQEKVKTGKTPRKIAYIKTQTRGKKGKLTISKPCALWAFLPSA